MTKNKKYIIVVVSLVIAVLASLTAMIVVLVLANQNATSSVNVKYVAQEVNVRISANAYVGSKTYPFKNGSNTGLELSPTNTTGSLSQTDSEIAITKQDSKIIFEYIFENLTTDVDALIDLTSLPATNNNFVIGYAYSDSQITDRNTIETVDEYEDQLLPAYEFTELNFKYIYIVASIDEALYNAELTGDFAWALSRTETVKLYKENPYMASLGVGDGSVKLLPNKKLYEPDYAEVEDKRFNGWYLDSNYTTLATFPMTLTTDITLYAHYQDGNVPTNFYKYDSASDSYTIFDNSYLANVTNSLSGITTLVIPDTHNGDHGVKPVTGICYYLTIEGSMDEYQGLVYGTNITHIYIGNNVKSLSMLGQKCIIMTLSSSSTTLQYVELGRKTTYVNGLINCSNLTNLVIFDSLTNIGTSTLVVNGTYGDYNGLYGTPIYTANNPLVAKNNTEYIINIINS